MSPQELYGQKLGDSIFKVKLNAEGELYRDQKSIGTTNGKETHTLQYEVSEDIYVDYEFYNDKLISVTTRYFAYDIKETYKIFTFYIDEIGDSYGEVIEQGEDFIKYKKENIIRHIYLTDNYGSKQWAMFDARWIKDWYNE